MAKVIFKLLTLLVTMQLSCAMAPFKRPGMLPAISRGGARPGLDPTCLAKAFGTACMGQGVLNVLAPSIETPYGGEEINECNAKIIRRLGLCVLNIGFFFYCLLFKGYNLRVSASLNALMWVAETISSLLNSQSETIGPSKASDIIMLAFTAPVAYSGLNDLLWFGTAFKACSILTIASSLSCISPSLGVKLWELKNDDEFTPGFVSICGAAMGTLGTLMGSLAWGVDPLTSAGYTCAAASILDLKAFFFTPEVDKIGHNKTLLAMWPIFGAVTAASVLL
jgi:hypothetical protein